MEDHQLLNMVTASYMRAALGPDNASVTGHFKNHPLILARHEQDNVLVDYSVLAVKMPLQIKQRPKSEHEEMLQPLAELCELCDKRGEQIPEGTWEYDWYYFELLDRDKRLEPICWISPELLYNQFPDEREPVVHTIEGLQLVSPAPYSHQLATMDVVGRREGHSAADGEGRKHWQHWLVKTWREHEDAWVKAGQLTYEVVSPWSKQLQFASALIEPTDLSTPGFDNESSALSIAQLGSRAGYPGLYWEMVPLYDRRRLSKIWDAMKHDLFVTSVFNLAAGAKQHPALWQRLENRFVLPFKRMSRHEYLVRLREQNVLEWTRQGATLDELADLLIDARLYCLDESEADRVSRLPTAEKQFYYHENAKRQIRRIRQRLREEGLIEKGRPGRPKKSTE